MKSVQKSIKKMLVELFYENNKPSMTLLLAFMGYLVFTIGSLYLLVKNIDWAGYTIFASYTGGGAAALQFGNKFINSRYNSIAGGYDERKVQEESSSCKYFHKEPVSSFRERK